MGGGSLEKRSHSVQSTMSGHGNQGHGNQGHGTESVFFPSARAIEYIERGSDRDFASQGNVDLGLVNLTDDWWVAPPTCRISTERGTPNQNPLGYSHWGKTGSLAKRDSAPPTFVGFDAQARHTFVLTVNLTSSLGPRGEAQSEFG